MHRLPFVDERTLFNGHNNENFSDNPILNFWIYSIASEQTRKLNCCKFIKMASRYIEPKVVFVAKY